MKSRERIINTFLIMAQDQPVYHINVRDLCVTANVSRSTFYRYFDSLYDLADELETIHLDDFQRIAKKHDTKDSSMEDYMREILEYIRGESAFFKAVLSEHSDRHFVYRWKKIIYQDIIRQYRMDSKSISDGDAISIEMLISGAIGAYSIWLFQKEHVPVEKMIPFVVKMWDFFKM